MCKIEIDVQKSEAFADQLIKVLNNGAVALMISIGHRTGLFDKMKNLPPSSIKEIADVSGLNERYVKEWLGAMTVSGVILFDPDSSTYTLPNEHASFLTREAAANNIAPFMQYISVLGAVDDNVVDCFKHGGGVPYSEFKRFHEVMAEDSGQSIVSSLFNVILPAVPGIEVKLEDGIDVLDLGCGMGKALLLMAERFPQSRFTGYDLSEEAINTAIKDAEKLQLSNVRFEVKDLTDFHITSLENKYDFITTFDAVHDQARPDNLLAGIFKSLKEDGTYLMQDIAASSEHHKNFDRPLAPLLYTVSTMHCMTVSLAQNGMGLGTMWGRETAVKMLAEAGFRNIEIKSFEHDFQNEYYIIRKD